MKTLLALMPILLSAAPSLAAEPTAIAATTVAKALKFVEDDMVNWRRNNECAACHHGPMYLWSVNVARRQGYDVNEQQLAEMTDWLLTDDESRLLPRQTRPDTLSDTAIAADQMAERMLGHKRLSQPAIYLTHALQAVPNDNPAKASAWGRVIDHLAEAQMDDGSFQGRSGRPPSSIPRKSSRCSPPRDWLESSCGCSVTPSKTCSATCVEGPLATWPTNRPTARTKAWCCGC